MFLSCLFSVTTRILSKFVFCCRQSANVTSKDSTNKNSEFLYMKVKERCDNHKIFSETYCGRSVTERSVINVGFYH